LKEQLQYNLKQNQYEEVSISFYLIIAQQKFRFKKIKIPGIIVSVSRLRNN